MKNQPHAQANPNGAATVALRFGATERMQSSSIITIWSESSEPSGPVREGNMSAESTPAMMRNDVDLSERGTGLQPVGFSERSRAELFTQCLCLLAKL